MASGHVSENGPQRLRQTTTAARLVQLVEYYREEIYPEIRANEMHELCDRDHKVSSTLKPRDTSSIEFKGQLSR